jgi:hypothetical protein
MVFALWQLRQRIQGNYMTVFHIHIYICVYTCILVSMYCMYICVYTYSSVNLTLSSYADLNIWYLLYDNFDNEFKVSIDLV